MRKLFDKKIFTILLISLLLVTSFSVATEQKNQKFSRLNPAIVQISLSKQDTLGKIIDYDFAILEINENYVIVFSSSEELKWLEDQNLKPKVLFDDYAEISADYPISLPYRIYGPE